MSPAQFVYKLVVVTRSDLKLSAGKTAVQVAHAAVSCALASKKREPDTFREWYEEGQKKVVLKAPDLKALYELKARSEDLGLVTSLIQDAGLTEIPAGTVTVLGIGPARDRDIDRVTGDLSLL